MELKLFESIPTRIGLTNVLMAIGGHDRVIRIIVLELKKLKK